MSTRWYKEKKNEHYYKQAKKDGYRARSAYKLKQIQKKFNVIKNGDMVVDLGAAPGGWSQVAKEYVGVTGEVVGVDILPINPIEDVNFIKGDMREDRNIKKIKELMKRNTSDVVLSDMSPDISGNYDVDQARSVYLCEQALKTCESVLRQGGNFVCKIFKGRDLPGFLKEVKDNFKNVNQFSPKASRKSSSEDYIVAKHYNKK